MSDQDPTDTPRAGAPGATDAPGTCDCRTCTAHRRLLERVSQGFALVNAGKHHALDVTACFHLEDEVAVVWDEVVAFIQVLFETDVRTAVNTIVLWGMATAMRFPPPCAKKHPTHGTPRPPDLIGEDFQRQWGKPN